MAIWSRGPPDEPPKKEKGEIDWEAWEARLGQKGVTGDVAERIAAARRGREGAIEELTAGERLANAGYQVRFIKPFENADRTNPDLEIRSPAEPHTDARSPVRVELKSGGLTERALKSNLERANAQIKFAEGRADRTVVTQQRGWVLYDATRTTASELDQAGVEASLRSSMTPTRFRQLRYIEVLYRDGKVMKRTFVFRHLDGSVEGPVTVIFSSP